MLLASNSLYRAFVYENHPTLLNMKLEKLSENDWFIRALLASVLFVGVWAATCYSAIGQEVPENVISELASSAEQARQQSQTKASAEPSPGINILTLLTRGGWFMVPIALMSLVVVAMTFERLIGLRRARVLPYRLEQGLLQLVQDPNQLDVERVHDLCNRYPSPAGRVLRTMVNKIGRPQAEMEATTQEESQREADALYSNVRYLTLAAGVSPLLGLVGTVWGLIRAFHDTSQLDATANRVEYLAQGIYQALVTTLAGLVVAIPAAILAHYFEGRIRTAFLTLEQVIQKLIFRAEPYENKVRFVSLGRELERYSMDSGVAIKPSSGGTPPPNIRTRPPVQQKS